MTQEGESESAEVTTTTKTSDDRIGIFAGFLHLFLGFKTNNGLMERDMVEHRSQGIFAVGSSGSQFDSLGDSRS